MPQKTICHFRKLAIVGSRTFNDYERMCKFISENFNLDEITHIVSGGARGADALAEQFAKDYKKELIVFKADWDKYGKKAGFMRNVDIIHECDYCVAFWDGISKGTKNDIELCHQNNKNCKICYF